MSVWMICPSARPEVDARTCVGAWHAQGYRVAMLRNGRHACPVGADYEVFGEYPGYAQSCNRLIRDVFAMDSDAMFCVCAGDDTFPDKTKRADEIARECADHFQGTFGVMQPTGDRWGENPNHHDPRMRSAYIDRVAGSPWIGREYVRRVYNGDGPYWHEYVHQFVDEEAREVAVRLGVYWERRELTHDHRHWGLPAPGQRMGMHSNMPAFLAEANSDAHWKKFRELFERRKAEGFTDALTLLH